MANKDKDPPRRLLLILLLLPLMVLAKGEIKRDTVAETTKEETQQLVIIGGNSLVPIADPCYEAAYALGDLTEETTKTVYTLGTLTEEATELMDEIMDCESHDNPTAKNPKSTAYGRCQMLESTRKYCEKKWGMEIDRENPEHQGYACERLLREEGTDHWLETEFCWNK